MNYHNILHDDLVNGNGIRTVLFVSGCSHHCIGCQNPQTHDPQSGIPFDKQAWEEIQDQLNQDYIDGITFSGGDPLCECNRQTINSLIDEIKQLYPTKTIWLYTGYTWEEIKYNVELFNIVKKVNVLCEGRFILPLKDNKVHWVGSTNQRVINISETLKNNKLTLWVDF